MSPTFSGPLVAMIRDLLAQADSGSAALRVAVITCPPHDDDDLNLHARHLESSRIVEIVAAVRLTKSPAAEFPRPSAGEAAADGEHLAGEDPVLRLYTAWDEWRNGEFSPAAGAVGHPDEARTSGPALDLHLPGSRAAIESVAAELRAREIDVILAPSSVELPDEIVAAAIHGAWTLRYGEPEASSQRHTVLRDLVDGRPVTQAWLRAEPGRGGPCRCIGRVSVPVEGGLSTKRVVRSLNASASLLPLYALRRLQVAGWEALLADSAAAMPSDACLGDAQDSGQRLLPFIARRALRSAKQRVARPSRRQWRVYARTLAGQSPWSGEWDDFREVPAPAGSYIADPFLLERDGHDWLFVEKYDRLKRKGSIIATRLGPQGMPEGWLPVLDQPHHLSFPFVFVSQGHVCMIPESAQRGRVDLYRADRFPDCWVFERTLWNHPAWDTVLHVGADGTHFFLCTIRDPQQPVGHLFLFTAADLYSDWSLHPSSPVSVDCRFSRNAGPLFEIEGQLHRVAQDPVPHYGRRMHFFRIDVITRSAYREVHVGTREPPSTDPLAIGTHAYSRGSRLEVVDRLGLDDAGSP
jgi:hypothetical protein